MKLTPGPQKSLQCQTKRSKYERMIKMQNRHGPIAGLMQGMQSNRGSPVHTGANAPPDLNRKGRYRQRWLMQSRTCSTSDHSDSNPFMIIVKPPGQSSPTHKMRSRNDIVQGLPVMSHAGLPKSLYHTDSPAHGIFCGETHLEMGYGRLLVKKRLKAKG